MYSLSNLEAADCCKAFLSSLYSPLVYRDLLELKQHYLGYMASEKTLLEWIINSIMTYNPAVTNLMDKGCSEVVNVKSEYEDDMSSSQTHCDVDVPNAPECCDALLHMLYGKDLCDKWRQLMHLMGYNSYSKFMQWCLENVQKQRVSYDGEEEDITQKYYTSFESEQATSQVSYEEVETALLSRCAICLRFFQSEIRLEQHVLAVHLKVSFITQKESAPNCCDLCTFNSSDVIGLAKHYVEVHPYYKPYLCAYCGQTFKHRRHLRTHSIRQHGISDLSQVASWEVWPKYLCCYCYQRFESEYSLKNHIYYTHSKAEIPSIEDKICDSYDGASGGVGVFQGSTGSTTHYCDLCGFQTGKDMKLVKHYVEAHPYYKPYLCDYCGHTFKHRGHVKEHWLKVHGISDLNQGTTQKSWPKNQCCYCKEKFEKESLLKKHIYYIHSKARILTKGPKKIDTDGVNGSGGSAHVNAKKIKTNNGHNHCDMCLFESDKESRLTKHYVEAHPYYKPYMCDYCGHTFKHRGHMRDHWLKVHGISDLSQASELEMWPNNQCCYCKEKFETESLVKKHIYYIHSTARILPKLVKSFERDDMAYGDDNYATGSTLCKENGIQKHVPKPYQCPECKGVKKCFISRSRLEIHIRRTHIGDADITEPSNIRLTKRMFTCKYCNVPKKGYYNLIDHIETIHENKADKYTCEICGFQTNAVRRFRRHELAKHTVVKDDSGNVTGYYCLKCEEGFAEQILLRDHIYEEHYRPVKKMCDICGKCFVNQSTMMIHRVCHSDARTALCPYCSRLFKNNKCLNRHVKHIHNKQKNFSCDQCDFKCSRGFNLRSHKVFAHQNHSDFQCEVCGKYLPNRNHLQQHMNKHGPSGKMQNDKAQQVALTLRLNAGTVENGAQVLTNTVPEHFLAAWAMQ